MKRQVAVITGAANGLGLALTKTCLTRGYKVVMADLQAETLLERHAQLDQMYPDQVDAVVCDVRQSASVANLVKHSIDHCRRVDYLFNNAGISGPMAPVWEIPPEKIAQVMDVNLLGAIQCIQQFMPLFCAQGGRAHIINIASMYSLCSSGMMAAYVMSKHALLALSESLYFDCQSQDLPVDISVVMPSFMDTALLAHSKPADGHVLHESLVELMTRSRPTEEVAAHILSALDQKTFYILPDREVKQYAMERTEAICNQLPPHRHSLQKLMVALQKRASANDVPFSP